MPQLPHWPPHPSSPHALPPQLGLQGSVPLPTHWNPAPHVWSAGQVPHETPQPLSPHCLPLHEQLVPAVAPSAPSVAPSAPFVPVPPPVITVFWPVVAPSVVVDSGSSAPLSEQAIVVTDSAITAIIIVRILCNCFTSTTPCARCARWREANDVEANVKRNFAGSSGPDLKMRFSSVSF